MTDLPGHRLGQGPLTISIVLRNASGMFMLGRSRVIFVALLLFGFPALVTAVIEGEIARLSADPGPLAVAVLLIGLVLAVVLRLFGPVMFAGYLDEAVGREYLFGHHSTFGDVMRRLPWGRLLVADFIVILGTGIGLSVFVVPGIAFYMLFGLVGPVIVQEERGLRDAFRRTMRISRTALPFVAALLLVPTAVEIVVHEVLLELVHNAWIGFQLLIEWLAAAALGGSIGLVEVALATELMARNPEPQPEEAH